MMPRVAGPQTSPRGQLSNPRPRRSSVRSHRSLRPSFLSALAIDARVAWMTPERSGSGGNGSGLLLTRASRVPICERRCVRAGAKLPGFMTVRWYNQAALISKPLARKLGLPHRAALPMRTRPRRVLASGCLARKNAGSRFVAILPHVRAAKLTINASYW